MENRRLEDMQDRNTKHHLMGPEVVSQATNTDTSQGTEKREQANFTKNFDLNHKDIIYINIQSLLAHRDEFVDNIVKKSPKVILLSETRVTDDVLDSEVCMNNYSILRCNSETRYTGGVIMYIKKGVSYKNINMFVLNGNCWVISSDVKIENNYITVGIIYHSPSSSHSIFIDKMEEFFENLLVNNKKILIMGDFNLNFKSDEYYVNKLKESLKILGLSQLIEQPTRCTDKSSTIIDLVISNFNVCSKVHDVPKISDHSIITVKMTNMKVPNFNNSKKYFRALSNEAFENINYAMIDTNWLQILTSTNINFIVDEIINNCTNIINQFAPLQTVSVRGNDLPWYDCELRRASKAKNLAYLNFRKSVNEGERKLKWDEYKLKRNAFVNLSKEKKEKYYFDKIDMHRNNSKMMWKTLKNLVNNEKKGFSQSTIKFQGKNGDKMVQGETDIANGFNAFFIESIAEIRESIPSSSEWSDRDLPKIGSNFSKFVPLNLQDLKHIIYSLDNKCNPNDILNPKVIKNVFNVIGHVLLQFVNTSLEQGVFPQQLKCSTITPIPKIKNSINAPDYRPINSLPTLEKILELAVYKQVSNYFNVNNLFYQNQSGFRKKHSCESALQLTVSNWKNLIDENNYIVAIFLDFKRAFETIDQNILLRKLKYYGIKDKVFNWFSSYLEDRKQVTKINNSLSNQVDIRFGVPQGSVLGPLLFIIYLNDIHFFVKSDFLNLFADDSLLSCSHKNINFAIDKMNGELLNVEKYLNINKLKLNIDKTKAMILTTKHKYSLLPNINLKIYETEIDLVTEIKYLGFFVDNYLSFKNHFIYIHKKISKKMFFFSRVAVSLSIGSRITVYNTIIQPHFNYCASLLFLLDNNSMSSLQKLQNRGMRIILTCNRYTPIKSMLSCLEWIPVASKIEFLTMIFIYKIANNLMPDYLNAYITYNRDIHNYPTRSRDNFYILRTNYKRAMNSLFYKGLNKYNMLPANIKEATSLAVFKRELYKYLK